MRITIFPHDDRKILIKFQSFISLSLFLSFSRNETKYYSPDNEIPSWTTTLALLTGVELKIRGKVVENHWTLE